MFSQDTVVALQALALYATKVFSPHGSSTVTVQSAGGDKHQFIVNQRNTLLYQERALRDVPGKYNIEVKGSACASVGVSLKDHLYFVLNYYGYSFCGIYSCLIPKSSSVTGGSFLQHPHSH